MTIKYGAPPVDLGLFEPETGEHMLYLYLPIKMAASELSAAMDRLRSPCRWPVRLDRFNELTAAVISDSRVLFNPDAFQHKYIYMTAKTMWVEPGAPGNRPGWHADGYGSNGDLNYIWSDRNPTQFCIQEFTDIPDDDIASLQAFQDQAVLSRNFRTYPDRHLLRLDESVIHRVNPAVEPGVRTFVKYSVSSHRYNLKGNSHNHLFDYHWPMFDRSELRNLDNKDFVPA